MQRWPGVIFSQRADFSVRYASPRIAELTGVPEAEWPHAPQRFWQVVHEADAEEVRRQCRAAVKTSGGVSTTYRVRNVHTSQIAYVLEHREAVTSKSGLVLGYECLWLDITRQTIAEKRLSSAAWKDTLATLTMGLAHDFGNIMSGILSLSELFLSQTQPDHPFHEGLGLIKQQSLQASNLVHRIVNLHRCKTGERNYHDLNQVINELTDLVQKVLPRRISVKTELSELALPVYMDGVEFRQVMLNLGLNAGDAMPQRGILTLRTRRFAEAQTPAQLHGKFPRVPCVCVEVQDDGTGIPARHLPFLFDPFFTTKPLNKGSGLGLYNACLFVEKHAGAISVESAEGKGTTFRLWLPEADFTERERTMAVQASRYSLLLAGSAGCLMDSTTEFLRLHDFYVIATTNPEHARQMLTEETVLDAVMLLVDPGQTEWMSLMADLPELRPPGKLVVQLVGAHPDQVHAAVLNRMDLVFTSDIPEDEFLKRLKDLLAKPAHV
jgi:signal transduction histidine kinase